MASRSIPGALIELFDSLTFTGKPSQLWFGQASLRDKAGAAVNLPLVEFFQERGTTPITFTHQPFMVQNTYRFEVWAVTLEACTDIVLGLLFNGGAVTAGAGFWHGTLTYAANSYSHRALEFAGGPFPAEFEGLLDPREPAAGRVHRGTFRLRVQAEYVGP